MRRKKKKESRFLKWIERVFLALATFLLLFLFTRNTTDYNSELKEKVRPLTKTIGVKNYNPSSYVTIELDEEDTLEEMIKTCVSFDIEPHTVSDVYYLYEEDLPDNIHIEKPKKPSKTKEPMIAIVIDDMGISHKRTKDINSLKAPLTSSFLTYGSQLQKQIKDSIEAGHEVIAHTPMEPKVKQDLAPDTLTIAMSKEDVQAGLEKMLSKFDDIKGINNHMGSRFTEDEEHMEYVMEILKERGLFFLDSKTSAQSKAKTAAEKFDVEYISRNVFLDNQNDFDYILEQIKTAEKIALKNGYAIAIGHPKSETYNALKFWLENSNNKKIKLVHLSKIIQE